MKIQHSVVIINSLDVIEKVLWTEGYDNFEFQRLYYELQRATIEIKDDKDEYVGVFECNGSKWFYDLDKMLSTPSGEILKFQNHEPNLVEMTYFLEHSKIFLFNTAVKDHGDGFSMKDLNEESWLAGSQNLKILNNKKSSIDKLESKLHLDQKPSETKKEYVNRLKEILVNEGGPDFRKKAK